MTRECSACRGTGVNLGGLPFRHCEVCQGRGRETVSWGILWWRCPECGSVKFVDRRPEEHSILECAACHEECYESSARGGLDD